MVQWYRNEAYILTENGEYSVLKSYNALLGRHAKIPEAALVWNSIMVPRHRFIVWLADQERLLTKDRLTKMHIHDDDESCGLCSNAQMETHRHIFANCAWFKELRDAVVNWSGISYRSISAQQTLQWVRRRKWKKFKKEQVIAIWSAMIYHTWMARNGKQF
ncbi:uncharacterized protein LOC132615281 [Lycium barbarum]|uniref:uncharacterized protein LOC132615279 n=1 Tax=Lycium barbarum TaxID=112863 RepID=UPI00293E0314|nr:uncharacterized protein LOC132615279 [Lycium barbarum]XP_060185829.1 uncharacterized protein LOC132615281 [Lycium barbarum]